MSFKSENNILYSFDGKTIYRYPHNGVVDCVIEEGVTTICSDAFGDIDTLKTVTFPKTIDSVGYSVFDGCNNLEKIYGYTNSLEQACAKTENVEFISLGKKTAQGFCGERLGEDSSKENVMWVLDEGVFTVTGSGKIDYCYGTTPMWDHYCSLIETLQIKDGITEIGSNMFTQCKYLKEVSIPKSTKCIDDNVFYGCENLKKIIFEGDTIKFGVYQVFKDCKFNTAGPLGGGYDYEFGWGAEIPYRAFDGCRDLTSITIPESVTYILTDAFEDCDREHFTIYGYRNSYAETYAEENNIHFACLGDAASKPNDKPDMEENPKSDSGQNPGTVPESEKVLGITVSGISHQIAVGKKVKLTADITPYNAANKAVIWTSGNKKIATVDSYGVVTVNKKSGGKSVTITATAQDGSGTTATYKITSMKGVVKKVAISGKKTVKAGKTLKLKAKVTTTKKANKKLKWTSSNTSYATVSSSGKVKALKAGKGKKVKITAMATDGSGKEKSVTVKIK